MKKRGIWAILAIAVFLRLINIGQSLWLDEAIGAIAVRDYSYKTIITEFIKADNHPPLYYLDLKSWTDIFGHSEFALRLSSIVYGAITVYLTYLIAKLVVAKSGVSEKVNRNFPFLSALLIATSQFHIYYSQEARMYAMAGFLASLAFYLLLKLLKHGDDLWDWSFYSITILFLAFSDYMPILMFPVFWTIAVLAKKNITWWKKFILAHLPLLIVGLAWLPIFNIQTQNGKWLLDTWPAWSDLAGGANLKQAILVWNKFVLGRISFEPKQAYYLLIGLASIPALIGLVSSAAKPNSIIKYIWLWLVVPIFAGFVISFGFPAFNYFRFVYVLPAFNLLIGYGLVRINYNPIRNGLFLLIVGLNLVSLGIYYLDHNQQRENWRQAVEYIEAKISDKDIVLFAFPEPFAPYIWYKTNNLSFGATNSISADPVKSQEITTSLAENKSGVYYFEYLSDVSDPSDSVKKTIEDNDFKLKEVNNDFLGVGAIYYYSK